MQLLSLEIPSHNEENCNFCLKIKKKTGMFDKFTKFLSQTEEKLKKKFSLKSILKKYTKNKNHKK